MFDQLMERDMIDARQVISGFPHPSGTNRERIIYLLGRKPRQALQRPIQTSWIEPEYGCFMRRDTQRIGSRLSIDGPTQVEGVDDAPGREVEAVNDGLLQLGLIYLLLCATIQTIKLDRMMKVYTVNDTAEILKVTPETIRRWARQGKLQGTNPGNGWRFTEKDIKQFLNNHRHEAKA